MIYIKILQFLPAIYVTQISEGYPSSLFPADPEGRFERKSIAKPTPNSTIRHPLRLLHEKSKCFYVPHRFLFRCSFILITVPLCIPHTRDQTALGSSVLNSSLKSS
ncbi:hypothetical protein CDAR_482351 [Caerostris darwini]|uniref:Uncharacterized protein n=1 Tax=Caerostris darwini TaxID=1538125 RepID=A0AAV4TGC2_9ARAC|nr:hypothetical protein CDAR_482351 [Caerostris darwini]